MAAMKVEFANGGANDRAIMNRFYEFLPRRPIGNVFWVRSTTGTNGAGYGHSPDSPLATIDYAVGLCTANNDDWIVCLPSHSETVSAAAGIDLDVAGITVYGIGNGTAQPKVDFTTATTADLDVDAANVTIENIQFEASFADLAAVIDVNATDCTIRNCRFLAPTATENAKIWILGATSTTSSRLTVEGCLFQDKDDQNTHAISLTSGTPDGCVFKDNVFHGFYETAAIGGTGAITNCLILRNYIQNADTDADACINFADNTTGIVAYNVVGAALACNATTNITVGTKAVLAQNFSVDTGDVQGVLDPAAT
jgi:hypothetical protein